MAELKPCPFCGRKDVVNIIVCDDVGCEYEQDPWSGLSYALIHQGWGDFLLCTDDSVMGGVLYDSAEDAAAAWNRRAGEDD